MEGNVSNETNAEKAVYFEDLTKKFNEMQDKMLSGIDQALNSTAEKLDSTAETMHKTAVFFRQKKADSLKEDFSELTKKHPGKTVVAGILLGCLIGKLISK